MKIVISENIISIVEGKHAAGILPICSTTGRILLCQRGWEITEGGTWANLGGGMNLGESPSTTAIREFYEEGGVYVPIKLIPSYIDEHDDGFKYYNFIGVVENEFEPLVGKLTVDLDIEVIDYKWLTYDEFCKTKNLHWGLKQLIKKDGKQIQKIINDTKI